MSTKVFVGNLAFRTTDQALTEAFGKHGEVKSGVIITRGRRSLGYGFVEFATAQQAADAVEKMKGAEIAGREIKVELAKDINEQALEQGGQDGDGPAKRRKRAPENSGNANTNNAKSNSSGNASGNEGKPKKPRNPRKGRNNEGGANASTNSANASPAEKPARAPRPPREKIPSKTTLFVANLPFSITDAQLLEVFKGTKAKAAHVALTRNGRSRGYGFVEFDNEADQLEALKTHQGKSIDGTNGQRNLSLTISHSVPNPPAAATPAAPATN
jgi:RNA recognition motif-containing protein